MSKKNATSKNGTPAAQNAEQKPAPVPQTLPEGLVEAAQLAAKKFGKRGRPLTHFIYGNKGDLRLYTTEGEFVEKFDKIDAAWDRVRELKASTVPMIKCWKVGDAKQILKKIKEEQPAQ